MSKFIKSSNSPSRNSESDTSDLEKHRTQSVSQDSVNSDLGQTEFDRTKTISANEALMKQRGRSRRERNQVAKDAVLKPIKSLRKRKGKEGERGRERDEGKGGEVPVIQDMIVPISDDVDKDPVRGDMANVPHKRNRNKIKQRKGSWNETTDSDVDELLNLFEKKGRRAKSREEINERKFERLRKKREKEETKLKDKIEYRDIGKKHDFGKKYFSVHSERYVDIEAPIIQIYEYSDIFNEETNILYYAKLVNHLKGQGRVSETALKTILRKLLVLMKDEPNILNIELKDELKIVGDIHGQFYDYLDLLDHDTQEYPINYLYLGDYVDRGHFSIEVCILLFCLKISFPDKIWIIRGNHETRLVSRSYGFFYEVKRKYSIRLYELFMSVFDTLPLAALVQTERGNFFCCHGGLSKHFSTLEEIQNMNRFQEPLNNSGLTDILWSDPNDKSPEIDFQFNVDRDCSVVYGYHPVKEFLEKNNCVSIVRAHQMKEEGYQENYYKTFEGTDRSIPLVITVFSAPNYCGTYNNKAKCMILRHQDFEFIEIEVKNSPYVDRDFQNAIDLTYTRVRNDVKFIFDYLWLKMKEILDETLDKIDE